MGLGAGTIAIAGDGLIMDMIYCIGFSSAVILALEKNMEVKVANRVGILTERP